MKRNKTLFGLLVLALTVPAWTACDNHDNDSQEQPPIENEDNNKKQEEPSDSTGNEGNPDEEVVYMLPMTKAMELTSEQRDYVKRNNDFAFNFYRSVNAMEEVSGLSNITSPLSLSMLMGMLNAGAQGETSQQIQTMLGLADVDKQAVNQFFKSLMEEAPRVDSTVTLKIANMVASDRKVVLEEAFKSDIVNCYHGETPSLDFGDGVAASGYINEWSKKNTDGMIPEVVSPADFNSQTLMALLNAVYFKATWANRFNPDNTREATFQAPGGPQKVQMMSNQVLVAHAANEVYSMVSLPYGGGDKWSMKVLLPNEGKTVDDIIGRLSVTTWKEDCRQLMGKEVNLKMPRFKTNTDLKLNSVIGQLGAPLMFSGQADFSPMTVNYKNRLCVSVVKQVAASDVDEEGTRLAAVSVAMMEATDMPYHEVADFHADRPFVYIVQEASSGAIFFIGTYRGEAE